MGRLVLLLYLLLASPRQSGIVSKMVVSRCRRIDRIVFRRPRNHVGMPGQLVLDLLRRGLLRRDSMFAVWEILAGFAWILSLAGRIVREGSSETRCFSGCSVASNH
jgi:hypothetical protein